MAAGGTHGERLMGAAYFAAGLMTGYIACLIAFLIWRHDQDE